MGCQSKHVPVLIYGAGDLGRELLSWIRSDNATNFNPIGFIDDTIDFLTQDDLTGLNVGPLKIMSLLHPGTRTIVAVGSGQGRMSIRKKLQDTNLLIEKYIHCSVILGERVTIGEGSIILPGTIITCDVTIGKLVLINCSCNIGHDVQIDDYSTLLGNNSVNGSVSVGACATLGSRSTILPNVKIGINATVGIGSVVLRTVGSNSTVFGVPAKKL